LKRFRSDVSGGVVPSTWWSREFAGDNQLAKREIRAILTEREFATPKPTTLLKRIVRVATGKNSGDLILDSFAGSGTTAHAVLALNKEDGGNRKFILVECEDYADSITAERVRRVIKGIPSAKDANLKKGLGGSFSYFELGKPIELESILDGKNLPSYNELARYVFYTATGEEFDERAVDKKRNFIGDSANYEVFLFYEPNIEILKNLALTLDKAEKLGPMKKEKRRLVFAPTKYLDQDFQEKYKIDFAQLPFEIYKLAD
jgi:adenine-specific DNA-methyltransferase